MTDGAVLVTGAAGALGSHLVADLLRHGRDVLAVGRSEPAVRAAIEREAQTSGVRWAPEALRVAGFSLEDRVAWQKQLAELEQAKTPLR